MSDGPILVNTGNNVNISTAESRDIGRIDIIAVIDVIDTLLTVIDKTGHNPRLQP